MSIRKVKDGYKYGKTGKAYKQRSKIDILATTYKISFETRQENKKLEEVDGYTDNYLKNIVD